MSAIPPSGVGLPTVAVPGQPQQTAANAGEAPPGLHKGHHKGHKHRMAEAPPQGQIDPTTGQPVNPAQVAQNQTPGLAAPAPGQPPLNVTQQFSALG